MNGKGMVRRVQVFQGQPKKLMRLEDDFDVFYKAIEKKFKVKGITIFNSCDAEIDSDSFCCIRDDDVLYFKINKVKVEVKGNKEENYEKENSCRVERYDTSRKDSGSELIEAGMVFEKDLIKNIRGTDETDGGSDSDDVTASFEEMISEEVEPLDDYAMGGVKRGIFLVFNCLKFKNEDNYRTYAYKDEEHFKKIANSFGFLDKEVDYHEDKSAAEIKKIIKETCDKFDRDEMDCLVCCVGSHGGKGDKISIYNKHKRTTDEVDLLFFVEDFAKCRGLDNKPKLFILQMCRGGKYEKSWRKTQVEEECDKDYLAQSISANFPDVILAWSTIPDHRATRVKSGSVFVETLREVAEENGGRDICEILTIVNRLVASMQFNDKSGRSWKQMPCFRTNLTRNLRFSHQGKPQLATTSDSAAPQPTPESTELSSLAQPEEYSSDEDN